MRVTVNSIEIPEDERKAVLEVVLAPAITPERRRMAEEAAREIARLGNIYREAAKGVANGVSKNEGEICEYYL